MRPATTLLLALAAAGLAAPASADVYKCTINGEIRYQDAPCPGQREQKPHLEVKEQAPPPPAAQPAAVPADLPAPEEAAGTLDDPNLGSEGGESTPAQLRAALEAQAEARRTAPPPAQQARQQPPDRLTELQNQIEQAQFAHRQLLREQREAMRQLAEKYAGQESSEAAIAERREADYQWRQRRLQAADRERGLRAELERLCPNGTLTVRGRIACR